MSRARMPALFIGHGNPMNAITDNTYTEHWRELGRTLPRPRAVLCISAHWYVAGTAVTAMDRPQTIHDFGGFPKPLYQVEYPAPGDPALARQVAGLLAPTGVALDLRWGLDHGAWSVLTHLYPAADVPVIQLSMDETLEPAEQFRLAQRLQSLREQGVLIFGSGNIVHNLHAYSWGNRSLQAYDWAQRFESTARTLLEQGEFSSLVNYPDLGEDALLSAPTPEHFLPLLYVMAQRHADDPIVFPVSGFDGGSISMLAVQIG